MSWDSFGEAIEKGPIAAFTTILILIVICGAIALPISYLNNASHTLYNEVAPSALLHKYGWFKDAAAQLTSKKSGIEVVEASIRSMLEDHKGEKKSAWPRDERETYNQKSAELIGLKMSFNGLAAEYNSQMAKINWAFCNVGQLPHGADKVLPREFAVYVTE